MLINLICQYKVKARSMNIVCDYFISGRNPLSVVVALPWGNTCLLCWIRRREWIWEKG